jgi:hypothetical protein
MASRRSRTVPHVTLAAACTSALIIAGCGGGGSSATSGGEGSQAAGGGDFTARANAICRDTQKAGASIKAPKANGELVAFFDRALALGRHELAELSALHPPSEKAAAFQTWLRGLNQAVYFLSSADAEARAGSLKQVETSIQEGSGLTQRNLANAKAVGLTVCANGTR